MAARHDEMEEFSFAAEGMAGTAASAALRRVRSFANQAPSGRMFAAIATLTEMSRRIETTLEAGQDALSAGDHDTAALEFARSLVQMDRMNATATQGPDTAARLPGYLRKRR